jgi:hypothetical protein
MAEPERHGPPLPAIPLLIFAAIDIAVALMLLAAEGFSAGFVVVAAIGLGLAGVGLWAVFSRAALERAVASPDVERAPTPRLLRPRRRRHPRG